jgi:bacterioferritin-associated ferredoxin
LIYNTFFVLPRNSSTTLTMKQQNQNDFDESLLERLPAHHRNSLDRNLCSCNEISKIRVAEAILRGAKTVEEVRLATYASDGNGCCRVQVQRFIEFLSDPEK